MYSMYSDRTSEKCGLTVFEYSVSMQHTRTHASGVSYDVYNYLHWSPAMIGSPSSIWQPALLDVPDAVTVISNRHFVPSEFPTGFRSAENGRDAVGATPSSALEWRVVRAQQLSMEIRPRIPIWAPK